MTPSDIAAQAKMMAAAIAESNGLPRKALLEKRCTDLFREYFAKLDIAQQQRKHTSLSTFPPSKGTVREFLQEYDALCRAHSDDGFRAGDAGEKLSAFMRIADDFDRIAEALPEHLCDRAGGKSWPQAVVGTGLAGIGSP